MKSMLNRTQLPDNIHALKALLAAKSAQIDAFEQERAAWQVEREALRQDKQGDQQEIARLTLLLDKLRRALFGQKSEKLAGQIDQLQLELEELHINQGERAQSIESAQEIGRAHLRTPVNNAPLVCSLQIENKKKGT